MKVYLESLGCKLNQAEVEDWRRRFRAQGWELARSQAEAALYVLNTCAVTASADAKSRHRLRLARRQNPQATIVAAGCYVARCRAVPAGADLAFDNRAKAGLVDSLASRVEAPVSAPPAGPRRTRSLVKIQEGCDEGCRYCIVPRLRGRPRSYSAVEVAAQVRQRVAEGCCEVVLTGTQPGAYGDAGMDLAGLVRLILAETEVQRLRLPSLQVPEVTPSIAALLGQDRVCRHLHLPLQSGGDSVLERMGRRYTSEDFRAAVHRVRQAVPETAITTDVMVGFPGETEAEFAASYRFCQEMAFAGIHVFPYSPRPGTAAAQFPGQVDAATKKERTERMLALARESTQGYGARFLGKTLPVLWEERKNGRWSGLTDNHLRVWVASDDDLRGQMRMARLRALRPQGIDGELG